MAEPVGLASAILALATFALKASVSLYDDVNSFRTHPKRVRDLLEELHALKVVLEMLMETAGAAANVDFSALHIPLQRCGEACREFGQELTKCCARSNADRTSFRDWAKMKYMGDDIDGFRRQLASYKSTINIALTDATLRSSSVTTKTLEIHKELIRNATDDLEAHLESINEKLEAIFERTVPASDTDAADSRHIQSERASTEKGLQICRQLSDHIKEIQLNHARRDGDSPRLIDSGLLPDRIVNESLQECTGSLRAAAEQLEGYKREVMDRLMAKSKSAMTEDDRAVYTRSTLHKWNNARDGFQVPKTTVSDIDTSVTSNSLWSNREALTDPSSLSHDAFASQDRVTEGRPTMTFFNYKTSETGHKFGKMDDDVQSIGSISDDIDSLAEPNSAMATFRHAAVTYVVSMLTRDPELLTLYKEATHSMGEAKFVRNHRRLLKEYFLELRADGQTPSQRAAIEFLRFRHNRTQISHGICNLIMPSNNTVQEQVSAMLKQEKDNLVILDRFLGEENSVEPPAPSETVGKLPHRQPSTQHLASEDADNASEGSDDSDDDHGIDDQYRYQFEEGSLLSNLKAAADFFTTGRPFRVYQDHLREFLNPTYVSTETSGILRPDLYALRTPDAGMARIYRKIWTFLSVIGLREHDIAPGHQRVRWKNRRGKPLYDDYIEHEPGALQALQVYLNSSAYRSRTSSSRDNGHKSSISVPSDSSNSSVQASISQLSDRANQARSPPGHARTSRFREDLEMGELSATSLHLLSCMELRRHAVVLHSELVTHITDDRHLFRTLRNSYHEHRGKLRGYCSLRTIHAIHFMKFAYGGRRYIDVRCHHEICEQGKPCNCLPPAGLVRPNGSEYECSPVPSKFSPPIGARLMMDFFTNPDDIELDSTLVLRQLPKWTGGNLQTPRAEVIEAWGIYYMEDWDWTKIWWILGIGFFPPSLLFGILWGILKQDIQGAFGVASWWMAGATIVVGIVGTSTWVM